MLPIETSVSQPCASASAASHSSLRALLPPYARPDETSSRLAQTSTPSSCERRGSLWIGDGQKPRLTRGKRLSRSRAIGIAPGVAVLLLADLRGKFFLNCAPFAVI